ncbi:MAG: hypothetical protein HQK53_03645 [Oligoflexia bacterium]|nr:hypothetical protein [Oligoflexia bacterium]
MSVNKFRSLTQKFRYFFILHDHLALIFHTVLITIFTATLINLNSGYNFFIDDHFVLSLKGIEKYLPGIFSRDYIIQSSNQAHWPFEYLTYIGLKYSITEVLYFSYWLLSIFIFSLSLQIFTQKYFAQIKWAPYFVVGFVLWGPINLLGALGPLYRAAHPAPMGASLILLGLTMLIIGKKFISWILLFIVFFVHIHQSLLYSIFLCLSLLFDRSYSKKQIIFFSSCIILFLLICYGTAHVLKLDQESSKMIELCLRYIPYHCFAKSWQLSTFLPLIPTIFFSIILVIYMKKNFNITTLYALLPCSLLVFSLLADRLDILFFNFISRRFYLHQFSTFTYVFTAYGLLSCFLYTTISTKKNLTYYTLTTVLYSGLIIISLWFWVTAPSAILETNPVIGHYFSVAYVSILYLVTKHLRRINKRYYFLLIALIFAMPTIKLHLEISPQIIHERNSIAVMKKFGQNIQKLLSKNSLVLIPPSLIWFRLYAQRSVVVDAKFMPLGGTAYKEFDTRMTELSGDWSGIPFLQLSIEKLSASIKKYKPTHVVLMNIDPKINFAKKRWILVMEDHIAGLSLFSVPSSSPIWPEQHIKITLVNP